MNIRKIFSAFSLILVFDCCAQSLPEMVPLTGLLSVPDKYTGKQVSTMGVFQKGEPAKVCLDAGSVANNAWLNCLVIQQDDQFVDVIKGSKDLLNGKYVQVIGYFDNSRPKPRGYVGVLRRIKVLHASEGSGGN